MKNAFAVITLALTSAPLTSLFGQTTIQPRFGDPTPGLSAAELQRFATGRTEGFEFFFGVAQGQGPIFNDTSCSGCHLSPVPGGSSQKFVTRFGKAASGGNPFDPLDALGGSLLQAVSINSPTCDEQVPAQANVTAQRITPPTFGFGLIEAIDDADILFWEANPPAAGISGKVHWVQPLEGPVGLRAGRFGWKAQVATVLTFSADASLNEQGITSDLAMTENAPNGNAATLALCDSVPEPEDVPDGFGFRRIDRMTDFQRFLAAPAQTPKSGTTGEGLFTAIGCADCHVASPYTTISTVEPALAGKTIKPYSDFLLHDMGATGDGIVQGMATENEFRTPPLWGLRVRASLALMHDGRSTGGTAADNVRSAISFHDGEASTSRAAFLALSVADQDRVIRFLDSLGQLEFDHEGDNDVDGIDWFFLHTALTGPGTFFAPDASQSIADLDQDGDFDLVDYAGWQRAATN